MNEGYLESIFENVESQVIVPNVWYTNYESESHQSFLHEGLEVIATPPPLDPLQQGDGVISWREMDIINDAFLHGDQQLLLIQPEAEATLWPQAEVALWSVEEPPLDLFASDMMELAAIVEPSGLHNMNNNHFFTDNSLWPVSSPIPSNFAVPIFSHPAADATSVAALVLEENQEQSDVVQVVEHGDGVLPCPKVVQGDDVLKVVQQGDGVLPCPKVAEPCPKIAEQGDGSSTPSKKMRKNHNSCERRRRDKISERINHLRELVPGCSKRDKASLLEQTCSYLKSLQDHVNNLKMLSLESNMMGMGMGMFTGMNLQPMMVPFPPLVPGSTWQNPANTAPHFPTVADMHGQYLNSHPTGYLQAKNKETLQFTEELILTKDTPENLQNHGMN